MNIKKIFFDPHRMGDPVQSLRCLRDTLAFQLNYKTAVVRVPTGAYLCGFMIYLSDQRRSTATFTGDGFLLSQIVPVDTVFQSGAYQCYYLAEKLLNMYGIKFHRGQVARNFHRVMKAHRMLDHSLANRLLEKIALDISGELTDEDFVFPLKQNPILE